jgi:hypothetical protein
LIGIQILNKFFIHFEVRKQSSSETDVKRSTETENTGNKFSEAEKDSLNASKVQDFKSNNSK